ncbi:MAG: HPr(Ser) kinase/phosphatase, partial [Mariprofundaceae bacterium]|nr:HPr(Ser) kinase/phosphatase [Mariprofundaceae bacterium]
THWQDSMKDERVIASDQSTVLHEVSVPYLRIPIRPGRSLAVIIEVATRNQLLKHRGIDSNQSFIQALDQRISQNQAE